MIRSKRIGDYFDTTLSTLLPGKALSFDVYLYFPQNDHILAWIRNGETVTQEFIDKYSSRGIGKVWIHLTEKENYERYLKPEETVPEPEPKAEAQPEPAPEKPAPKTPEAPAERPVSEEAATIQAALKSETLSEEQKEAVVAEVAKEVLAEAFAAETLEEQEAANEKTRAMVEDVLSQASESTQNVINEIWALSDLDPEFEHAVNVSAYAVVFAMAFGKIKQDLIVDLATAGLLHDIGLSQVSPTLTQAQWKTMDKKQLEVYGSHVKSTVDLLTRFSPEISKRVHEIILQHHEKFDGTGYPNRLKGFAFDDVAQIVAMADLLESISNGSWDGTLRPLKESLQVLEKLEKTKSFPQYFNPEIYAQVIKFVRSDKAKTAMEDAAGLVGEQAKKVIDKVA